MLTVFFFWSEEVVLSVMERFNCDQYFILFFKEARVVCKE